MKFRFSKLLIIYLCLTACFSACGPSLGSSIDVPKIPLPKVGVAASGITAEIFVQRIDDGRATPVLARYKNSEINSVGDISSEVKSTLERGFRLAKFTLTELAPIVILGEVKNWSAKVESGFPGSVYSEAALYLEVFDPTNKRIYHGLYRGMASIEHPSLNENMVKQSLGQAMSEAISQVFADKELMSLLLSF